MFVGATSFFQLGKLHYDRQEYNKLARILKQLHQSCKVRDRQLKEINGFNFTPGSKLYGKPGYSSN